MWKRAISTFRNILLILGIAAVLMATSSITNDEFRGHFINLMQRAWGLFTQKEGTTTPGFASNIAWPIISLVVAWYLIRRERGKEAAMKHSEEALLAVRVVVIVALLIYGPMAAWCVVKTVYEDHQSLAKRNGELVRKNRELGDTNSHLVDPKSRDDEIAELKRRLDARQQSPHTATPLTQEAAVRVVEQKEIIPSPRPEEKHALQVTIEATRTIQPVHLRLQCDGPLHDVYLREPETLMQFSYGVVPGESNVAEVTFAFPPIDKDRPVVVLLFSNQPVNVINVRNVQ
jgi:hypothetical protein